MTAGIGVFSDIALAFYPIYLIGPLQHMKMSLKIGLCLILGGGIVAGVAGINKTIAIATITQNDITFAIAKLNTWVLTEMWFIIIFGSIPVLRPFFVRFSQQMRGTSGINSDKVADARFAFVRRSTRESRSRRTDNDGSIQKRSRGDDRDDLWLQLDDRPCEYSVHGSAQGTMEQADRQSQDHGDTLSAQRSANSVDRILVTKETTVTSERIYGQAL